MNQTDVHEEHEKIAIAVLHQWVSGSLQGIIEPDDDPEDTKIYEAIIETHAADIEAYANSPAFLEDIFRGFESWFLAQR